MILFGLQGKNMRVHELRRRSREKIAEIRRKVRRYDASIEGGMDTNTELDGEPVSEAEVWIAGETRPWQVFLSRDGERFRIRRIVRNQAEHELDWYDNNLHQAYLDMTDQPAVEGEEEALAGQIAEMAQLKAFAK
jgi:hypothetical protein